MLRRSPVTEPPAGASRALRLATWIALPAALIVGGLVTGVLRGWPGDAPLRLFLERAGILGAAVYLVLLLVAALAVRRNLARHARDAR